MALCILRPDPHPSSCMRHACPIGLHAAEPSRFGVCCTRVGLSSVRACDVKRKKLSSPFRRLLKFLRKGRALTMSRRARQGTHFRNAHEALLRPSAQFGMLQRARHLSREFGKLRFFLTSRAVVFTGSRCSCESTAQVVLTLVLARPRSAAASNRILQRARNL